MQKKSAQFKTLFLEIQPILKSFDKSVIPIFDNAHPKKINELLIFINLYQHAKNLVISSICSRDIADIKMVQSDWLRAFWLLSHKPDFSQIRDLRRNTANGMNFRSRTNSKNLLTKFFSHFKKPYFWPILPILGGAKQIFPKNSMSKFRK